MAGKQFKNYRYDEWNVEFSHPVGWQIAHDSNVNGYRLKIAPSEDCDAQVQFRMLEAEGASLESLLEKLALEFPFSFEQFKMLNKGIKTTKAQERRAVLVFQHGEGQDTTINQEVIFPIEDGKFLFFRASSREEHWQDFQHHFAEIMRSVHYFNPEEVEIDFGDSELLAKSQSLKSGVSTAVEFSMDSKKRSEQEQLATFDAFADRFDKRWKMCPRKEDILAVCENDEDLAKVIWAAAGSHALQWVMEKCHALGGKTPKQALQFEEGRRELRNLLFRLDEEASNLIEICKQPPAIEEDPYEALSKLRKLLEVQDAYRNTLSWTTELARLANHVVFYVPENPYSVDNYGYPYLMVGTELLPEMGNARRMRIAECIEEVTDHGAGLVIDPHRGDDGAGSVIFPFGHTWAVREFGRFPEPGMFTASAQNVEPRYEFEEVNSQLLPPFARRAFKNFLEQAYGFQNSQVCIQRNVHDKEDVVFVFNLLDFSPEQAKLESIMSGLFWFCRHGRSLGACKTDRESKEWLKPL